MELAPPDPVQWLRPVLAFFVFGGLAVGALEIWLDRFAWPIDPSWYALDATSDHVHFSVQHYRPIEVAPTSEKTRILFVGGSTTFGFPERPSGDAVLREQRYGYVGVLAATLEARWPGRYELVNLGINGGASEDTLRVLREAMAWDVDGVVVYDGHNEFLSAARPFHAGLWRFATYRRFAMLLPEVKSEPHGGGAAYGGPDHAEAVHARFERNLHRIADAIGDVPWVISTQASDLTLDPAWDHAGSEGHFAAGRLVQARDADPYPMRATSPLDALIRSVGSERGASVVEPHVPVDAAHFWDQVHPRGEGTKRVAEAVMAGLVDAGLVEATPPTVVPELTHAERVEATSRAARGWLQLAGLRKQDPAARLARLEALLQELEALEPGHPDLSSFRELARELATASRGATR